MSARRIHRFYNLHQTEEDAARWWRDHILLVDRNRVTEAQLLTVIEDFRHLVGKGHVGAGQLPAGNADRPVVLAGSHCRVAAALFERFRHRLRVCVREEFERAKRECESQNCQQTHCAAR